PGAFLTGSSSPRRERSSTDTEIQRFIARKADLLFAQSWKPNGPLCDTIEENEEYYAVMPPLEQFMEVPREDRRELFFRDIERGDIVIGRITSIREFGFFMVLICLGSGVIREITDLELTALCPLRDVPSHSNHGDPLSYYQTGDIIRGKEFCHFVLICLVFVAAVKDVDRYHEKLTVSLYSSALPPNLSSTKLGVITSDEFPVHYRRSMEVANTLETYEEVLHRSPGFANPSVVEYLAEKLGLSESNPPSLMRGLQIKNFNEEDFAPALRKRQSASWALKCVKTGVDYFKVGRHVEAMNEYNKALEIDSQNVEALVARGALYATKGSLNKAIDDFEIALENCPTHRNARKYLCQTLVERGGQLEEDDKLLNAESYYKKALSLDETFQEAEEALTKLRKHMQKSLEMREKQAAKEERQKEKKVETSAEKLRKLLKEEKRLKKKRKRSTSSSSSSSSSSSDSSSDVSIPSSSSSSDHKKRKKKHRNKSESSRSSKKHSSRSSHYKDQIRKDEWYSPPADTSASFLNQRFEVEKLLERQDSLVYPKEVREKDRYCSLSRTSAEDEDTFGGRSEDSRDSYSSSRTQASSSKIEKHGKTERFFSSRRSSSGSCYKSDDKTKMHYFRKLDREVEGEREQFKRYGSGQDRYYPSPAGSDYSGKSVGKYKSYSSTCLHESDKSYDSDRHLLSQHKNERREYQHRERSYEDTSTTKEVDEETTLNGKEQSESGSKRNLPQNLLNIFNQIAEFEREKGSKQKNQ
ncbi:TTC14 protein, partial [Casuarius casuarius]|nr:TTC14 protein [Casuarius casuarius]